MKDNRTERALRAVVVLMLTIPCMAKSCGPNLRADTRLNADGTLERRFIQPVSTVPEDAGMWSTFAHRVDPDDWNDTRAAKRRFKHLASDGKPDAGEQEEWIGGYGRFKAIEDLPAHLRVPAGNDPGDMERRYTRTDAVIAVEHDWNETLTNSFRLSRSREARDKLAALSLRAAKEVFATTLGKKYDGTALFKWLETDGRTWWMQWVELHVFYAAVQNGGALAFPDLQQEEAELAAHFGLNLRGPDGGVPLDSSGLYFQFLGDKLVALLKPLNGKGPVDATAVAKWLHGDKEQPGTAANDFERFAAAHKDDPAFAGLKDDALAQQTFGRYVSTTHAFSYVMTVPGNVVETNGMLLAPHRVWWSFDTDQAFPAGYTMHVRTLDPAKAAQKALLHGRTLDDPRDVDTIVNVVKENPDLVPVLRACVKAHSVKPLEKWRAEQLAQESRDAGAQQEVKTARRHREAADTALKVLQEAAPSRRKR